MLKPKGFLLPWRFQDFPLRWTKTLTLAQTSEVLTMCQALS